MGGERFEVRVEGLRVGCGEGGGERYEVRVEGLGVD